MSGCSNGNRKRQWSARDPINGEDDRLPRPVAHGPTPTGSALEKARNEESGQATPGSIDEITDLTVRSELPCFSRTFRRGIRQTPLSGHRHSGRISPALITEKRIGGIKGYCPLTVI